MKHKIFALLMVLCLTLFSGCGSTAQNAANKSAENLPAQELTVKMLDVGQGDSLLIESGGKTTLIDTGDLDEHAKFEADLKAAGVKKIDTLIITHPHADHLGGASVVFQNYPVGQVFDNGEATTTKFYRNYLSTIKEKNIPYRALRDGDVLDLGGGATFTVLSPTEQMVKEGGKKNGKRNLNLNSIVGRLQYGSFTMLFTGDAEKETEAGILERHKAADLQSEVLKSPHHGSHTSSTQAFLEAVHPEVALISCGAGNDYGHPHKEILQRYQKDGIKVYRTDLQGTITITTDGQTYQVKGEKES